MPGIRVPRFCFIVTVCQTLPVTWNAGIQTFQKLPNFKILLGSSRQDMSASWETSLKLCNLPVKFDSQPESHWVRLNLIFKFNLKLWDHWQERTYFDFLKWFWIMISHKCRLYLWIHNNVSSCQAGFQVNLSLLLIVCCNLNFSTWFPKSEGYGNCLSARAASAKDLTLSIEPALEADLDSQCPGLLSTAHRWQQRWRWLAAADFQCLPLWLWLHSRVEAVSLSASNLAGWASCCWRAAGSD